MLLIRCCCLRHTLCFHADTYYILCCFITLYAGDTAHIAIFDVDAAFMFFFFAILRCRAIRAYFHYMIRHAVMARVITIDASIRAATADAMPCRAAAAFLSL